MDTIIWAAWGFLGAFVYAAIRFLAALPQPGLSLAAKLAEFAMALSFGPIFAAGFGPLGAGRLNISSVQEMQALALVIGMVANPLAPVLVKKLPAVILRRIGVGPHTDGADHEP